MRVSHELASEPGTFTTLLVAHSLSSGSGVASNAAGAAAVLDGEADAVVTADAVAAGAAALRGAEAAGAVEDGCPLSFASEQPAATMMSRVSDAALIRS
jgi:hypothetical protein